MSADHNTDCPACVAKQRGVGISTLTAKDLYEKEWPFAHYYETYIDQGKIVFEYSAHCRECDYSIEANDSWPLPEPEKELSA